MSAFRMHWVGRMGIRLKLAVLLALTGWAGHAASLLLNPGFELGSSFGGWQTYGANTYNLSSATQAHGGTNYLKVYQAFTGAVNYDGIYQDFIAGPGAAYDADGWLFTATNDAVAGQNAAWIEVTFRDANANILALYRSALINTNTLATHAFPKSLWTDLRVTNQYDPATFQVTNTVTKLVAPPLTPPPAAHTAATNYKVAPKPAPSVATHPARSPRAPQSDAPSAAPFATPIH